MLMGVKTNQGKTVQLRGVVRRILVLKLKTAKKTLMELMNGVMEIVLLEKIMKNPMPMKIMMVVKNNQGKLLEVRRMVVMKQKKIMSQLKKKEQTMMEMMKNQGKKTKETVMELMNVVMEITTLVEIVKNPVPMKIMMRGIIRRMVVMTKQMVMEREQTVMDMMTNQGKTVELMVVERRIVVMKKKQMMSWMKKAKQIVKEMMDVVMEIMAVMIIMTKNQQKKMDMRRNQDPLLRILSNQKKNLNWVSKTASQRCSDCNTSKTNKNQNKEEKMDDCPRQRVRCVYCQILEQKLFFNDGIKNSQRIVLLQKTIERNQENVVNRFKIEICVGTIFFCLGEEFQNRLATISICANVHMYLILPRYCKMSLVTVNDTNE
jgi:hypothetical protein